VLRQWNLSLDRRKTDEKLNDNARFVFDSRALGRRWIYFAGESRSMGQENHHDHQ
jgi:hypothetical protein